MSEKASFPVDRVPVHTAPVRPAFTLIELLVVIAIVAVLIALLVPAVQKVREAAARTTCTNNLKQLGLAIHHFHDVRSHLPAGVGPWSEGPRPAATRSGAGWILLCLPYLEQANLYDQFQPGLKGHFDSSTGINRPECSDAMRTILPVLQCPSDPSAGQIITTQFQWEGTEVATTSYKGVIGDTRMGGNTSIHSGTMPDCHTDIGCNGLFYRNAYQEPIRLPAIQDGTSNTFAVGEDVVSHNNHAAAYYANGDYASCHAPLNYFPEPPTPDEWWNVMSFRSLHSGGANFCMADSSVHFVSETIDHTLYRALSTRDGREIVEFP